MTPEHFRIRATFSVNKLSLEVELTGKAYYNEGRPATYYDSAEDEGYTVEELEADATKDLIHLLIDHEDESVWVNVENGHKTDFFPSIDSLRIHNGKVDIDDDDVLEIVAEALIDGLNLERLKGDAA